MINFNDSLRSGRRFEALLADCFPDRLELLDGTQADLRHRPSQKLLEVKTESRTIEETENFFVEHLNNSGRTIGGPWQALSKGVELYAHFFPRSRRLYLYLTSQFCRRADEYLALRERRPVQTWTNGNYERYYSLGYPIPRLWFSPILVAELETDAFLTAVALEESPHLSSSN